MKGTIQAVSSPAPPCLSSPPSFQGWDISPSYGGGGAQTSNPFSLLGCCAGALANSSFVPALCVLPPENWNGYQVAHLRGLRAPGKVNLAGRDSEPAAALPPGRAMEPPRRRARSPEKPTSAPGPRRLRLHSDAGAEFSRTEARPGLCPGLHVPVHRTRSDLNVLIVEAHGHV